MKKIYPKIIAIGLLVIGLATIAQARINYWTLTNNSNNFEFNFALPVPANKYCPNAVSPLTNAEIDEIIQIHNQVRAEVGVGAVKWNCDLAKFSQDWAVKDTFEHSTQEQRSQIITGSSAGENLAVDSRSNATMAALNKGWIDEKAFYTYADNTCAEGKVCGHYTQMVWKSSNEIGCGVIRNSNSMGAEYKGQASYFVCTYNPGGNMDGEKPY